MTTVDNDRIKDAAALLGVSDDTLRRWIDAGRTQTPTRDRPPRVVADDAADPDEELETPLLEARNVSRHFTVNSGKGRTGKLHACDNIDLRLRKGMIIGLVGESGSGKTTLARLVSLFYPLTDGELLLEGVPAPRGQGAALRAYRQQVQLMFQDPFGSLNTVHPVSYTLGRVLKCNGFKGNKAKLRAEITRLLEVVRLRPAAEYIDKYPHELSGGQRQRVVLARALAVSPKIILADEPVSMLDVSIRAEMLNLLTDLRDNEGLSMLYVTHDMAGARYLCDEIAVLYAGQMVEYGSAEEVISNPRHPYTQLLVRSSPNPVLALDQDRDERFADATDLGDPPNVIDPAPGCRFASRCPHVQLICQEQDPPKFVDTPDHWATCWLLHGADAIGLDTPAASAPAGQLDDDVYAQSTAGSRLIASMPAQPITGSVAEFQDPMFDPPGHDVVSADPTTDSAR